jgi:uncharacterized protein (TIGR00730 family)
MSEPVRSPDEKVSLNDEAQVIEIIKSSVYGLWQVVNNLTRLRPTRRERYAVTIFGSARVEREHWVYDIVRDLAAELTRMGCDIISGGGPGLMQAANEGAASVDAAALKRSVGIRIELPFEQDVNPFVGEMYEHGTFFTRLHHFVLRSDAFVAVPGGIGTVLEVMMIWQLLQARKLDAPLILAGPMWQGLIDWCRAMMLRPGFELAGAADLEIPRCVASGPEAVAILREHHAAWERRMAQAAEAR